MSKFLIVFAGPNGSGKSTLVKRFLADTEMPYIFPDDYARYYARLYPSEAPNDEYMRKSYMKELCDRLK